MPPSSPSWVGGFSPPGQAQAKAEGRELFPAHVHARSCWQGCPPQAHCSRALCQHCQPTSMGTCGVLAAHPKTAQAVLAERLLLSWCHLYITEEPAQACALCSGLRQDPAVPAASPLRAFGPMTGYGAVPPSQEHCQPLSPHSPSGMGTCQSKPSWPQRAGAACAQGLVSEWGPGQGCSDGYAVFPGGFCPRHPALTPSHKHLLVSGSETNSKQSPGSETAAAPVCWAHRVHHTPAETSPPPAALGTAPLPALSTAGDA